MANYDYEIVNGRKIRVRPKETVSEIDKNGYFRRQPNHFTTPFGDGENDLQFLEVAGTAVAMANAVDSVKQKADIVTKSNNENGVCTVLNDLLSRI